MNGDGFVGWNWMGDSCTTGVCRWVLWIRITSSGSVR